MRVPRFMTPPRHLSRLALLAAALLALAGCHSIPADALKLAPESALNRELQTRRYDDTSEPELLAACAGVVQDLGFNLDGSESKLGLIAASRSLTSRRPLNDREITGSIAYTALVPLIYGPITAYTMIAGIKEPQTVRISLVTSPGDPGPNPAATVRLTAQRVVYSDERHTRVLKAEPLNDPEFYREFFNRLAKSAILEKQKNAP